MPVQVTYPGVYVQEAASGVHTISGVATSVAAFIGMAPSGPVNEPVRVLSYRDYESKFGGPVDVGEMSDQVRMFFLNGGGQAWIVRTASGASSPGNLLGENMKASSTLRAAHSGPGVLTLTAKDAGAAGNLIRVEIDYNTSDPERTFNLTAFRAIQQSDGSIERADEVVHANLSMNPASSRYAPDIITAESALLSAEVPAGVAPGSDNVSQSGLIYSDLAAAFRNRITGGSFRFMIAVGNSAPVPVTLEGIGAGLSDADTTTFIAGRINDALGDAGQTETVSGASTSVGSGSVLRITSGDGSVKISSHPQNDVAQILGLGVDNGGLEMDGFSELRPAPNGFVTLVSDSSPFSSINNFAAANQVDLERLSIQGTHEFTDPNPVPGFDTSGLTMSADTSSGLAEVQGSFEAVVASLQAMAEAVNNFPGNHVSASVHGYRIQLLPRYGNNDADLALALVNHLPGPIPAYNLRIAGQIGQQSARPSNVVRYAIGLNAPAPAAFSAAPAGDYRDFGQGGSDGEPPTPGDYAYAYDRLERFADIFNIMVLPRAKGETMSQSDADRAALWGPASAFCASQLAILIADPYSDSGSTNWDTADKAVTGIQDARSGVVLDYTAMYWPRVKTTSTQGDPITIDPSGTLAGVYAKTDLKRGVWKAPAGLEASLLGVSGLEFAVTNPENGLTNPQALNTLRSMSTGATSWGARTMVGFDGTPNPDYRYVPVRRLALYIEKSMLRGLGFAVFEPNGEQLWGQIRLAAGAFMNGLYRQGAFKGEKKSDAYFVACGPDTTTQTDINNGIVNVEIGFAPLKVAEFVVITVRQMVGQIET